MLYAYTLKAISLPKWFFFFSVTEQLQLSKEGATHHMLLTHDHLDITNNTYTSSKR